MGSLLSSVAKIGPRPIAYRPQARPVIGCQGQGEEGGVAVTWAVKTRISLLYDVVQPQNTLTNVI